MAGLSLRFYFLLILATLPVFTWSINFGYRKFAEREEFDPRYIVLKRQASSAASASSILSPLSTDTNDQTCSAGSYLCPASLSGGCCPSGLECGLTNCFPSTTSQTSDVSSTESSSPTTATSSTVSSDSSASTSASQASTGNVGSSTTTPTSTRASSATTRAPSTTPSISSATFSAGETISAGNSVGVVGTDGVTRFCTVGSALCPASVSYGCCQSGLSCGLTNCVPTTSAPTTAERTCSVGYLCASSLGYGCCPNGYSCGTASCFPSTTLDGQGVITVTKTQNNFPFFETGKGSDTSTTGASATPTSVAKSSHGLSGGAIGGIVGGILGGVILIGAAIGAYFFNKNRKARTAAASQPPMSQPAAHPGAGNATYGDAGAGAYSKAQAGQGQAPSYDNRTSYGPSELGGDDLVTKPYGNQMPPVHEANPVAEAPGDSVQYPNYGQNPTGHQVFEVDGTSAVPRN